MKPLRLARPLTNRQQEVIALMSKGLTESEMARSLGIAIGTVRIHKTAAYRRMGVASKAEAIQYALQAGITEPMEF